MGWLLNRKRRKPEFRKVDPKDALPQHIDGGVSAYRSVIPKPFKAEHFEGRKLTKSYGYGYNTASAIRDSNIEHDPATPERIAKLNKQRQMHNTMVVFEEKALYKHSHFSRKFIKKFYAIFIDNYYMYHLFVKNDEAGVTKILQDYSRIYTFEILHRFLKPDAVKPYIEKMKRDYGINTEKHIRRAMFRFWYSDYIKKNSKLYEKSKIRTQRADGIFQSYWKSLKSKDYRNRLKLSKLEEDAYYNLWIYEKEPEFRHTGTRVIE
jgi:hypothetical protein